MQGIGWAERWTKKCLLQHKAPWASGLENPECQRSVNNNSNAKRMVGDMGEKRNVSEG